MTAIRIKEALRALQFSVIGQDAPDSDSVKHVGLLFFDDELDFGKQVRVIDMGPPLRFGAPLDTMFAHTVGYLEPFTREQQRKIELWLTELRTQAVRCEYRVRPASGHVIEPGTERVQYRFFSCPGFVADCYEKAGVALIDQGALPPVGKALTRQIWGLQVPPQVFERVMSKLGLEGQGPWHLLLPGYILHALNAPPGQLPYAPRPGDWRFP